MHPLFDPAEHLSPPPPATSYSQTNHMFHPPLGFQSLLQQKQHAVGPQSSCNHIPIPSRCLTSGVVYSQVKVSAIALAIAAIASLQIRNPDSCEVVPGGNQRRGHTLDATAKGGDSSECGGVSGDQDDIEAGLRGTGPEGEAREGWGMNWSEAVEQFGFRVCLQEEVVSSKKKRHGKKSKKKRTGTNGMVGSGVSEERGRWNKDMEDSDLEWVGPAPWDKAVGGDGVPKFLCDTMVRDQKKIEFRMCPECAVTCNCSKLILVWVGWTDDVILLSSCCGDVIFFFIFILM